MALQKIGASLILLLAVSGLIAPQRSTASQSPSTPKSRIGTLLGNFSSPMNNETSGIAVSRRNRKWDQDIFWVHNDSGDKAFLYAVTSDGDREAVIKIPGATSVDWEDIAWGPGPDGKGDCLYIGDIGDNDGRRDDCVVYRIREPKLRESLSLSSREDPLPLEGPVVARRFAYPDGPHDAETLLVHPKTGIVYIVTKSRSGTSGVYKFPPETADNSRKVVTLEKVAALTVPDEFTLIPRRITGGSISPDGRRIAFCTYFSGYELKLPANARDFDAIWKAPLLPFNLPPLRQTEAITYTRDGKSVIVTSEGVNAPIYAVKR
ncbi:MAG: hypothetical protein V4671_12150 [Armatimonadota bacterium]